jgi:hypothetical protein
MVNTTRLQHSRFYDRLDDYTLSCAHSLSTLCLYEDTRRFTPSALGGVWLPLRVVSPHPQSTIVRGTPRLGQEGRASDVGDELCRDLNRSNWSLRSW